ncbi:MAG: alpha/beta fold hydrolase [Gammaproteobacteria bacterium]|nr:alpha/beta fold hydrolase [Gammaproteobacteria bacterium]
MLARSLRIALVLELIAYLALGAWLAADPPRPWWSVASILLAVALGARAAVVAYLFAISEWRRAPRTPDLQIGPLAALRLFLREWLALSHAYLLLHPFAPQAHRADAAGTPVLLVHGFLCNAGVWAPMRRRLAQLGHANLHTLSLEPVFGDIEDYADQVARAVEELCACSGAAQLVVVGHSMGGLAARAYLRRHGTAGVARLVTLGTPHHGTVHAHALAFAGRNLRQMRPGSDWLRELNRTPPPVPTTCLYSPHDNIVAPQDSGALPGAHNIALPGVGHMEIAMLPAAAELIAGLLAADLAPRHVPMPGAAPGLPGAP